MTASPLELSEDDFRAMVEHATAEIVRHVASLPTQTLHATGGGKALARSLREGLPETGADYKELVTRLVRRVMPRSFNTASPGYLAYIPGGGLLHSAVADLVSSAVNRYVGVWVAAPGLAQIETNVVRWFGEIVGYAGDSDARRPAHDRRLDVQPHRHRDRAREPARRGLRQGRDLRLGSGAPLRHQGRALRRLPPRSGVGRAERRAVPDRHGRARRAHRGRRARRQDAVHDRRERRHDEHRRHRRAAADRGAGPSHGLWLHVDAAYGGFFALTSRGKRALAGLERADSITLDPHKSLFLPYGTGALVVRSAEKLRKAHAMEASYMPPMQSDDDFTDFCDLGPELSRDFRGLRVWLPLKMHGAGVFREALDEKLDLAASACEAVRAMPHIEIVAEPAALALRVSRRAEQGGRRARRSTPSIATCRSG